MLTPSAMCQNCPLSTLHLNVLTRDAGGLPCGVFRLYNMKNTIIKYVKENGCYLGHYNHLSVYYTSRPVSFMARRVVCEGVIEELSSVLTPSAILLSIYLVFMSA